MSKQPRFPDVAFMRRRLEQRFIERQHRLKVERNWSLAPHTADCPCVECLHQDNVQADAHEAYIAGVEVTQ